jgi:phosphatidate cytidylyltransferase
MMKIRNLYKRSGTAVVFAAVTLFLVLFNTLSVHVFTWLTGLLCAVEYLGIRSVGALRGWIRWMTALLTGPLVGMLVYFGWVDFSPATGLIVISVLYMLFLAGRLFFSYEYGQQQANIVISTFLYIGLPLALLNQLMRVEDPNMLVLNILLLIWAADTFAYLTGSVIGKTRLLPRVSPGKTVEGAFGGLIFALLAAWALNRYFPMGSLVFHFGMALIVWFFGLVGDLVESQLKRHYGLKDSGKLLPGHGGFLDRFDAFIYVLPFVLLFLSLMK